MHQDLSYCFFLLISPIWIANDNLVVVQTRPNWARNVRKLFLFHLLLLYLFSSSKHWELKSIDFYFWHGTDGRTDGGETEGTLRVPRRPKNESTLQWNLRWLSSEQSKMNDSSACKIFHCFSPCPAGAPYPPALIKQRCTLPLIKQRGSTDVMVQNFCWPSQPTN